LQHLIRQLRLRSLVAVVSVGHLVRARARVGVGVGVRAGVGVRVRFWFGARV
jgi:hypothetical protein